MPTTVTQLVVDASGAEQGVQRYTTAMQSGASASDRLLGAHAKLQATIDAQASAYDANTRAAAAMQQAMDRIAEAQSRASSASAASVRAANDNSAALSRQSEAYKTAGQFALQHPVLVLAGSVAAARALSGLATSAAGSLGAASASTAAFAEGATGMSGTVVAGAALAARGLAGMSTGATAAAGGLSAYADKVAGFTTATSLLSRGLALIPPLFLPIAAAFVAFEIGSAVISKANSDLQKLIDLGLRAQQLDVGASFLKGFESLGPKLQATTDQMDAALSKAAGFLKDSFGQTNNLSKLFGEINATGVAGASGLKATTQADLASNTQERIQAAIAGMKELDELGLHLASLKVGDAVFGPEFMERLRTGQTTIAQFSADLEAASQKEVLNQDQVDRAVALNRAISDTKQAISDEWAVNVDFSAAGTLLNEIWLKILQGVLAVVQALNDGIAAVTSFGAAVASSIGGAFDAVYSKATALLSTIGLINKQQATVATETPKVDGSHGPQQPTITARQFPYVFGPDAPKLQQAAAGAKQAKQAATEAASSYDNLIQKTKDHIAELDLEAQYVGKDADAVIKLKLANQLARAAQKNGTEVTAEMRAEWDRLGDTLATSTKRLEESKRAYEQMKEGQRELASEFSDFADDLILGGKKMGEAFASLAKTLSSNALKAVISGEGPLAGILGTASTEKGQLGGLLGGGFNFSSLFGGGSNAAGSPLPGAQGPSLPSGSLFGGLFDSDKISKALSGGASDGIGSALSNALKPQKAGGGILSSQLGQGLVSVGTGAAIGYSSQSPLMGALGGGLAGLASGNPLLAIAGAGAGLLGGLFGESQAKKEAKKKLQQEIQARKEALEQARPQIEALAINFEGGSIGNVGKVVADAQTQLQQAAKTASEGGDQALADKLMRDFQTYVARQYAVFADGFNGILADVQAGFGTSGPFATAVSSVQALGEALKGFVADASKLSDPASAANARAAAVQGALSSLDPTPQLSATQAEIERINGTAAGLSQVLKDLGLSADQAATAINDRTNKALDALADKFSTDLDRKINDAKGKSYLNDAADLIKEVVGLNADAASLGQDGGKVTEYFSAAAQKIVNGSQLAGDAFNQLVAAFPQLAGVVHEFSADSQKSVQELAAQAKAAADEIERRGRGYEDRYVDAAFGDTTLPEKLMHFDRKAWEEQYNEWVQGGQAIDNLLQAQEAERAQLIAQYQAAIQERREGFQDRRFAATNDTTTLAGQLAAFERQAQKDRRDEIKAGGEAINDLTAAQEAERAQIIQRYNDAILDRIKGYSDRLFNANNDTTTLTGQLAAFDRKASDERLAEAKAGGEAMAYLEQAQYAERLKIINDFNKQAKTAFDAFANTIKKFLDDMLAGSDSPLSPQDRLNAAQSLYDEQLKLAQRGDQTALGGITGYAQSLLDASKAFYASSQGFQDTFKMIRDTLGALPSQVGQQAFAAYADGGWVRGPGTGTSDSIIARLSNGEYVVPADVAARNRSVLEAMNDNRSMSAIPGPRAMVGGSGDAAMIEEMRAIRAELRALRATAEEGNSINEEGHLQGIAATKDVNATLSESGRVAARREVA